MSLQVDFILEGPQYPLINLAISTMQLLQAFNVASCLTKQNPLVSVSKSIATPSIFYKT